MPTYYYALNSDNEIIINSIPDELLTIVLTNHNQPSPIKVETPNFNEKVRIGSKRSQHGSIHVLTNEKEYLKSFKKFKELVKMSTISLRSMSKLKEEVVEKQTSFTQELIHNLTSLNTYSIQDIFALIPQDLLTDNLHSQQETVKRIFSEKPNVASHTFLQIIKYTLAMKVEFSVFDKTTEKYPTIQKIEAPIRKVVLSALQIFISDFEEKNIDIHISASSKILSFDNDIFFVSLYYLLENAVKYSAKKTKLKIHFNEEESHFAIEFNMISIPISEEDKIKICNKGYRSKAAKIIDEKGQGLGMYRILKTLKMNDAQLEIIPRASNFNKEISGITYEHNQFIIKFPGQQNWFAQ